MQHIKGIAASLIAFVACPCHLPLTLPLLLSLTSGTVVGVWLAAHQQFIWSVSVTLFVASVVLVASWLREAQAGAHYAPAGARSHETTVPTDLGSSNYPTPLQASQKVEI